MRFRYDPTAMRLRVLLRLLLTIVVLGACAWLVRRQLAAIDLDDLRRALAAVSAPRLALAAVATLGSFGALARVEFMLFAAIATPVRWRHVLPVAFIADTVSASVGLVMLSGALLRLRLYRRWQVSTADVVRVSLAMSPVVVASGLLGAALAMVAGFGDAQRVLGLATPLLALLALALAAPAAVFVAPAGGREWRWGRLHVVVPSRGRRVALLGVGLGDWACAGTAAFLVTGLPAVSWPLFVGQFIFGWLFGATSGLPAGAGAIDATMLATFGAHADLAALAAGLLLFRLVYFIGPTLMALALWAAIEWTTTTTEERA